MNKNYRTAMVQVPSRFSRGMKPKIKIISPSASHRLQAETLVMPLI
ncbi:MAG: hypothetical protein RLP97_11005 [Coleofasciculus chthonoplastes F2-STO-03]